MSVGATLTRPSSMEQILNPLNSMTKFLGATLVVARARHPGRLDSGTGQARPLRPLFPARLRPGPGVETPMKNSP